MADQRFNVCLNYTGNLTVYLKEFYCSKIIINMSTCLPRQTTSEMDTIQTLCEASDAIFTTGFWFSLVLGIVGNGLALFTIASLPLSTATFYVGLLAFSDFCAICIRGCVHLLDLYGVLNRLSPVWDFCHMMVDFSASYSSWTLVLICLERYLTVRFPLHKRSFFTIRHARVVAVVLAALLFIIYNTIVWEMGYSNTKIFYIRNLLYAVLPLILIILFTLLISYQLRKIQSTRKSLNAHVQSGRPSVSGQDAATTQTQQVTSSARCPFQEIARIENCMTTMMLVAAVCFSVLTIPSCVIMYTYRYATQEWNTPVLRARWHFFFNISRLLTLLNLSVNFLLYFLSVKKFRLQMYKVVKPRSWSVRTNSAPSIPQANNSMSDTLPLQPMRNSMSDSSQCFLGNGRKFMLNRNIRNPSQSKEWNSDRYL